VDLHEDCKAGEPSDRWDMAYHRPNTRLAEGSEYVHRGRKTLATSSIGLRMGKY
jgi:hypothetical protein